MVDSWSSGDWDKDPYDPQQARDWQILHDRITAVLDQFGRKDAFNKGDYWLVDDNYGWTVHIVEVRNINMFQTKIIGLLQDELAAYPTWSIEMRTGISSDDQPSSGMGITIHPDEIIDELQRNFLPPEFADRVFASALTCGFKMLVYEMPTGVETEYDWKDETTYRPVAGFLRELLGEPDTPGASDPNRVAFYCLVTREDVTAFDRFLKGMKGRD